MARHRTLNKPSVHKWITLVLAFTTVFLLGVFAGWEGASSSAEELSMSVKEAQFKTEGFLLEQQFIRSWMDDDCEIVSDRLDSLSAELSSLGKTLNEHSTRYRAAVYRSPKLDFHLLQIRTYVLMKEAQDKCESKVPVILYFYGRDDTKSSAQGKVLDSIAMATKARIFAIEHNYASELSFIESFYDITQTPSIVVNYDTVLQGYQNQSTITALL